MDNIQTIADLAVTAEKTNRLDTHKPAVILQQHGGGQAVVSIEYLQAHRSHFRGNFSTHSLQDFASYVVAKPGGAGFIQPGALAANVIFDLHVDEMGNRVDVKVAASFAGHADHNAQLNLKATPAYAAMLEATEPGNRRQQIPPKRFGQKDVVEWLEDWWDYLAADYPNAVAAGDGATPQFTVTNDPTGTRQALNAIRKIKIKATGESVHTDKDFGTSRSALEDVEASSDVGLPRGFRFTCQPSDDLDTRTFYLRLGVITSEEKPQFVLRWSKRESDIEAVGQNFKAKLLDAIGDKATMLLGTFDPGK